MSEELMSDTQILQMLGERYEEFRLHRQLQDKDVMNAGGVTKDAINKFKNKGGNITLLNFIKILRGTGQLEALSHLFNVPPSLPKDDVPKVSRIRKKIRKKNPIEWKD